MLTTERIDELADAVRAEVWVVLDHEPDLDADAIGRVAAETERAFRSALQAALEE